MAVGWSRAAVSTAGALLLAACVEHNPEAFYAPPPGLAPDAGVTVLGSKAETSLLQAPEYRFVQAVDGKPVANAVDNWDRPVLLAANAPHRLKLLVSRGVLAGSTEMDLEGAPGSTYLVKAEDVGRQPAARMWLEERASGRMAGEKTLVQLSHLPYEPMPAVSPTPSAIINRTIR